MSASLGIDKAILMTSIENVAIDPDFKKARLENPIDPATGEALYNRRIYRDTTGREVRGQMLSANKSHAYQFAIKPDRSGSDSSNVFIGFSGNCFRENNLEPLGRDALMDSLQSVERDLKERGVSVNLEGAKLVGLHITPNVQLEQPIVEYAGIFGAIGAKKRSRKLDFGGTGFILGNKEWEISFYDKMQQMKDAGYEIDSCPPRTLRPEARFNKGRQIFDFLGVKTVPELRSNWEQVPTGYRRLMEREVFKPAYEDALQKPAALDWGTMAAQAVERHHRNRWQLFKSDALAVLMVRDMGLDVAKHFVQESFGYDLSSEAGKRQIDRIHRELEIANFTLGVQGKSPKSRREMKELYRELRDKILSAN